MVTHTILGSPPAAPGFASGGPTIAVGSAASGGTSGLASGGPPGGGCPTGLHVGLSGGVIWHNSYFFIRGHAHDLKMYIFEAYTGEAALGRKNRTRTITPSTVGESRDSPTRTLLCLKAWMCWRAKQNIAWLTSVPARQRLFEEEERQLYIAIRALQPTSDRLLGNSLAATFLKAWIPDVVQQLEDS